MGPLTRSLIALATTAVTLAACGATPSPKSPAALRGRAFLLESSEHADVLAGATVRLHFTDKDLALTASCNHMGGGYEIAEERLVVGDMFQTEMGCDAQRHAQDAWLQTFFRSKPALRVEGARLTLVSDTSRLVFLDREIADPDRPLQGTVWAINTYTDADTAMGLMLIEPPRITFAGDGTWRAHATCLEATGNYAVDGDRIALSHTQATQGECVDNDKIAAEFMRSVLADGGLTYEIEAGSLELKSSGPRSLGALAVDPDRPQATE